MRVAIDARSLSERNTSNRTYWSELVNALGQCPTIELLLMSNAPIDPADIPPNGVAIVAPTSDRWFSLNTLPRVAREARADVVHVQYTVSPFFGMPVVTTIHDVSYFIQPSWFSLKDRLLLQSTVPAACRRAARVIAPSETCREEILAFIDLPPEKVMVTLEGTPNRLLGLAPDSAAVERLVDKAPFTLLVGGFSPRKNLKGAVAAVREARRTIPDLRLLVTGSLTIRPDEPWVVAPGPLDEPALAAAYQSAHALLHPSLHEGFGLTILEAMALGCPVVASDRGSIPEIANEAARLFDPFDAAGMAEALVEFLNPAVRASLVGKGRERAVNFTWDATASATVAAYQAAVGKGFTAL